MGTNGSLALKDLTAVELQHVVLMVRSKKQFAIFLGITDKEAIKLWSKHKLATPVEFLRKSLSNEHLTRIILVRDYKGAADFLGVSKSTLKLEAFHRLNLMDLDSSPRAETAKKAALIEPALRKYGSIRLTSRMLEISESEIRRWADSEKLDLATILRWDESNHSTGKGRRAELDAMAWRGTSVQFDANITMGSKAPFDFQDRTFGQVNVKSSVAHPYKAQTKKYVYAMIQKERRSSSLYR